MSSFVTMLPQNVGMQVLEENSQSQKLVNEQVNQEQLTPNQPLPGSSVTLSALWRMVEEQMKEVANAVSGTGKENSESKKTLIELQKDSQLKMLKDRESQLEEQQKTQKKKGFWSKFAMALGFIAAIVIAPFNPVMSAVMIGTMVASIVVPKIADEIMKAAGVPEETRAKVRMGLEITIGLVGMLASFNPSAIVKNIGKAASKVASNVAHLADRALDAMVAMKSLLANLNPAKLAASLSKATSNSVSTATNLLDSAMDALRAFKATIGNAVKQAMTKAADVASKAVDAALDAFKQLSDNVSKIIDSASSSFKNLLTQLQQSMKKLGDLGQDFITQAKKLSPENLMNQLSDLAHRASGVLKTLKTMSPSQLVNKAKQLLDDAIDFITSSDNAALKATRMNQVAEFSSNTATIVSTGYGIKSADIVKDMEVAEAKQDELSSRIEQILMMLEQAMRAMSNAFESMFKVNSDFRDFNKKMLSIHM